MPVRNRVRVPIPNCYFHVYNRGHNKDRLFYDEVDFKHFEWLLERCFGKKQQKDSKGRQYPWFGDKVQLHAYCLMPNHFHLLLYQGEDATAISKSIQSLAVTYSMYFNKKYNRRGSVFESAFKASNILNDSYLLHVTRYIHLNPDKYESWEHSSYKDYIGQSRSWVITQSILELFDSVGDYAKFVDDYKDMHDELEELKYGLADNAESIL